MSIQIDGVRNEIVFQYEKNQFKGLEDVNDAVQSMLKNLNLKFSFILKKRENIGGSMTKSTFQILEGRQ